jgi:hypothetical protein
MKRLLFIAAWALAALALPIATGTGRAAEGGSPSVEAVANALQHGPVYVDPRATEPRVDASRLVPTVPAGTYLAVLPASAVPADADPTELPGLISDRVGKGGTFVLLVNGKLYGASTTLPGQLPDDLGTAQSQLPAAGGDATGTLIALMRSLSGSGDLQDAPSPSRAGGPVGWPALIAIGVAVLAGALALWWWLRRPARPRRQRPPERPRDLVEVDHAGRIIRRTPASEREGL